MKTSIIDSTRNPVWRRQDGTNVDMQDRTVFPDDDLQRAYRVSQRSFVKAHNDSLEALEAYEKAVKKYEIMYTKMIQCEKEAEQRGIELESLEGKGGNFALITNTRTLKAVIAKV